MSLLLTIFCSPFDPYQDRSSSTQLDLQGIESSSLFGDDTAPPTTTLLQIPTSTGISIPSDSYIAMNGGSDKLSCSEVYSLSYLNIAGITADSSFVLSRPTRTSWPSAHTGSNIPLALPIVTAVLVGTILLLLLVFSILLCRQMRVSCSPPRIRCAQSFCA